MRTVTETYNVYNYNELSEEAKEKAKQWYLDDTFRTDDFTSMIEKDLQALFDTKLNVQYSLNYCQGDGLNVYGKIYAESIRECLQKHNGGSQLEQFEDRLTEKEWKRIYHYAKECDGIELPQNNRYCYCVADRVDIAEDWFYQLENYSGYANINMETLQKFEKLVIDIFTTLCRGYEEDGYKYFYEVEDEEMTETCEANGWEFLEDGSYYAA